jgi:hypothetical protein
MRRCGRRATSVVLVWLLMDLLCKNPIFELTHYPTSGRSITYPRGIAATELIRRNVRLVLGACGSTTTHYSTIVLVMRGSFILYSGGRR